MAGVISSIPTSFCIQPFSGRWFHWSEISACFWPGAGGRSVKVNQNLAAICHLGGIYCLGWSVGAPKIIGPTARAVRYIGETARFKERMSGFRNSAGLNGNREFGHSAGWRWPLHHADNLWVSFFLIGNELLPHLAGGLRGWMEAVALEEYRLAHGQLPIVNGAKGELSSFEMFGEPTQLAPL
jgi:hypothetical protein